MSKNFDAIIPLPSRLHISRSPLRGGTSLIWQGTIINKRYPRKHIHIAPGAIDSGLYSLFLLAFRVFWQKNIVVNYTETAISKNLKAIG